MISCSIWSSSTPKCCQVLSSEAKDAAAEIGYRLQMGLKLSELVNSKVDAFALFDLFRNEGYLLTENKGKFCVSKTTVYLFLMH